MPALVQWSTRSYTSPTLLLSQLHVLFEAFPEPFNIMYPQIMKMASKEHSGQLEGTHIWITCSPADDPESIDMVLACSETKLGKLPVFIASPHLASVLADDGFLRPRLQGLVSALYANIKVERVFSVFAVTSVAQVFSELWTAKTGINREPEPYYFAMYARCILQTLKNRRFTILGDVTYDLRVAVEEDLSEVAKLCYAFAKDAAPFILTEAGATEEARLLIAQRQVWVHTIERPNQKPEIASIVAVTRESLATSAITKVFTSPNFRGKRCAERLVRHVTNILLQKPGKTSVVLYVACNNEAARTVYHRVGFNGIGTFSDGTEQWLEIGFDQNRVDLGHW